MKIAKALALYSIYSRRKAEELVLQGCASINKSIINNLVCLVTKEDKIKVDNQNISTELLFVRI